jgi:hypothetical protein
MRRTWRGTEFEIRPLGGGPGCLMMIVVSVVLSVTLTACVNLLAR